MEELEKSNRYSTASHNEDIDFIFDNEAENFDLELRDENLDLSYVIKIYYRLFRKKFLATLREKIKKDFINILYLTLDCPNFTENSTREDNPCNYIIEMQKQYPNNDIRILIPIINVDEDFKSQKKLSININGSTKNLEKTSISFDFFMQNKIQTATVYKYPKTKSNIQVYGIYSASFSNVKNISELSKLQYLAPFLKSARIAVKKLSKEKFTPDIIHCEHIPYYLGAEFESKFQLKFKVLQIIKDFTQVDIAKSEAFWAAINLADKKSMKKICQDKIIKKCIAKLFNLHNTKRFYQMKDCLKFIYKNYYKFRKYVDKGEDVEENIIFNRLNARIMKIFPQISYGENLYFNPMIYTLKKVDFWATISKSYYKEIFEKPKLSGKMFQQIEKTKDKSSYVSIGFNPNEYPKENTRKIYQTFNSLDFRELRHINKSTLIKEFSADRIKTGFTDPTLFKDENAKIYGSLDSFYEAPLLFANSNTEIFANGVDVLFNSILKLFELHKNIQVIISVKDGMKTNFVKNWVEFLSKNKYLNGRWVFIDSEINLPKFLSSADMILLPRRANSTSIEHFIAMNYGAVPIASRCGILNDTIPDIFDDISDGCGFKTKISLLNDEDSNELFLVPLIKALNLYQNNPNSWNLLIKNCITSDNNWNFKILERYNRIYQKLL